MIHPTDFIKYGFGLWVICMLVVWIIGFLGIYGLVGFPEGILESAREVLQSNSPCS